MYSWECIDKTIDATDRLALRTHGLLKDGVHVVIDINGFRPYFYVEFSQYGKPCHMRARTELKNRLNEILKDIPCDIASEERKKLYYDHREQKFLFFKVYFQSIQDRKKAYYKLTRCNWSRQGKNIHVSEFEASPLLQFMCTTRCPSAGWVYIEPKNSVQDGSHHYTIRPIDVSPVPTDTMTSMGVPSPIIMSMDIEVYSSNRMRMPDAEVDEDQVFQISCVMSDNKSNIRRVLLTLGNPDPSLLISEHNIETRLFGTEAELLLGWAQLVVETRANVICGYNIFGFDMPYMISRAKRLKIFSRFLRMGIFEEELASERVIRWSSSAYRDQEFYFIDIPGRLVVDLLPVIKRDYKFSNYKLKTVSEFFIGDTKDPLTPHDIFDAFSAFCKKAHDSCERLTVCGRYCVQDSELVLKLFDKLGLWVGLSEMAKVCNVPMITLFTQGQQIKVFSQVYKLCTETGRVVDSVNVSEDNSEQQDDGYTGAYVFPPVPGLYEWVVPFDFSSLYPTTIIAYNIDYSTLVLDPEIPDAETHVIEWIDHNGCEHDVSRKKSDVVKKCVHHRYRFRKAPLGVIPGLLKALLQQRASTKKEMKDVKRSIATISDKDSSKAKSLHTWMDILDKRQLAYKVSANSMYGAMGVKKGYLPFMPGAMSTTAMGRMSIQKAADFVIKNHNGQLIYGDTDSIYCHFADATCPKTAWEKAKALEKDFLSLFPDPMKLVFEEKIYSRFLILTKKRYMAYTCGADGRLDADLTIRGVLLARRDNCRWIRTVYEKVVREIMDGKDFMTIHNQITHDVSKCFDRRIDDKDFVVTKSVAKNYVIRLLPTDPIKCRKRLQDMSLVEKHDQETTISVELIRDMNAIIKKVSVDNTLLEPEVGAFPYPEEWKSILRSYCKITRPAHVQLAMRMGERGFPVQVGSRIEYIVLEHPNKDAKMYEKIEDPVYFRRYKDIFVLDYLYYLKLLSKPLDQLLSVVFKNENVVTDMYKRRFKTVNQKLRENAERVFFVDFDDVAKKKPIPKRRRCLKNPIHSTV